MDEVQAAANELIEQANAHHRAGRLDDAIPLFRRAAELFPPYASFMLVAADSLYELGRLPEAVDAYRATVEAVPEHEQAWESMALILYQLDRRPEADAAMARYQELDAGLTTVDVGETITKYWDARELEDRVDLVNSIVKSFDERVPDVLHHFVRLASADRLASQRGLDYWSALASIMVRFDVAPFVHWYTDGPAPDRDDIASDVRKYLASHSEPPPLEEQQPVWSSPPPNWPRSKPRKKRHQKHWWQRS